MRYKDNIEKYLRIITNVTVKKTDNSNPLCEIQITKELTHLYPKFYNKYQKRRINKKYIYSTDLS